MKIILFLLLIAYIYFNININIKENNLDKNIRNDNYNNQTFAIITRKCNLCGLFSFYIVNLGCIHKYLLEGYIPIIDIKSFPNVIKGFNISKQNNWEIFFNQPFGYTLDMVLKKAKKIKYIFCNDCIPRPDSRSMIFNKPKSYFWHNFANRYLSIKKEIINLAKKYMNKLFKSSKNILGVLTRGTDYISRRPKGHPIPPNITDLISDVKAMDSIYNYKYIFFSTEDEKIRDIFSKNFNDKLKQIKPKDKINYDYSKKKFLNLYGNIKDNVEFNKIYLLNIIILSKCLDIITAKCSGALGIFVLTKGFRNIKVYNLGFY